MVLENNGRYKQEAEKAGTRLLSTRAGMLCAQNFRDTYTINVISICREQEIKIENNNRSDTWAVG
jgi:hypothetical protein